MSAEGAFEKRYGKKGRCVREDFLNRLPYPVYVVTARKGDGSKNGNVVTWLSQAGREPVPYLAAAVAKADYTHGFVDQAGAFAVHLLRQDQIELGKRFGFQSGRQADKFAGLAWREGPLGVPLLEDALGFAACRVVQRVDCGSHTLFVGEVVEGQAGPGEPLSAADFLRRANG